jgi:hypothetical protein
MERPLESDEGRNAVVCADSVGVFRLTPERLMKKELPSLFDQATCLSKT